MTWINEDDLQYDPDDDGCVEIEEDCWEDIYSIDSSDSMACDEEGHTVECDFCGTEIRFDDKKQLWVCKECGAEITRVKWFDWIGANPPGKKCLTQCNENYPVCKIDCPYYKIPDDDPMMN